jgi:hypothetical protein
MVIDEKLCADTETLLHTFAARPPRLRDSSVGDRIERNIIKLLDQYASSRPAPKDYDRLSELLNAQYLAEPDAGLRYARLTKFVNNGPAPTG